MKTKAMFIIAALATTMVSSAANAKINYTAKDGRTMCCDSVGPSGWAAQGCTGNPSGGQCAAIKKAQSEVNIDRKGRQTAVPERGGPRHERANFN